VLLQSRPGWGQDLSKDIEDMLAVNAALAALLLRMLSSGYKLKA